MNVKQTSKGFTVIELLVATVLLIAIGVIFWTQKNNIETANRDESRKISINALHYALEKVYVKEKGYYPKTLAPEALPAVDENLFKDPNGVTIGKSDSDFRYESTNCDIEGRCQGYMLRSLMENEADYVKKANLAK